MALQYNTTHRTNSMQDLVTLAGGNAKVKIFDAAIPAQCSTADAGNVIVQFTAGSSVIGTVANGVLTMGSIAAANATLTGTPTYFRVYPSAANTTNAIIQGSVGTIGSGADMIVSSSPISANSTVTITNWTITAFGA